VLFVFRHLYVKRYADVGSNVVLTYQTLATAAINFDGSHRDVHDFPHVEHLDHVVTAKKHRNSAARKLLGPVPDNRVTLLNLDQSGLYLLEKEKPHHYY